MKFPFCHFAGGHDYRRETYQIDHLMVVTERCRRCRAIKDYWIER